MATKTLNKSGGTGSLSPNTTVTLTDSDPTLTITIGTGLAANAQISRVQFYNEVSHVKQPTVINTWWRTPPTGRTSSTPAGVTVAASGDGIVLTDSNYTNTTAPDYYYNVKASDGTEADPELILNKRTPPTAQASRRPLAPEA